MRRAPSLVALAVLVVGAFPVPTSAVDEPAARAAAAWFRAGVLLDGAVAGAYSAEERAAAAPPNDNFTFADAALVQWLAPGLAPLGDDLYAWRARPDAPSPVDWWRARAWATTAPGSGNPCNDWSRAVLALVALGEDPRAFGGTDHVAKVLACHRGDGTWDDPTTAADDGWSNNDAFALLALRAAGYPVDDAAVASTVAALVATQHADGGFAMHGEPNSLVDDTAMITTALLSVLPPSHDAPRRALLWLEAVQLPNGGYVYLNRESPDSAAVVMEAVIAAGEDPDAGRWRKPAGSLEEYLLGYRIAAGDDAGAFARDRGSTKANVLTTYLALRAFSGGALPVTLPTVRVEGGPAVAGREAALHAEASVPVGRIEAWRWDLGDGAGATGERIAHAYDSAGPRTVTVTVTTDRGVEGTARVLLDVLPADRLPIEVPSVARRGDAVEARADVVAGTVLRFDWGDGNATDWTTTPRATHAYSRLGAYVVRAEARAPAGDRSSGEATVVVENVLPVLVVPPKHEADRVAPARLVAAAADPDGPEPRVTWTFPDGAALEGPVVERRFEALGEVVVRVEATDGDGGVVEEETRVAVVNLPPTLALVVPTVVRVGDTVVLRAEAGDADGGAPAVRWMLPGGGEVTGPALAWVADSDGERVFAAIATDLDGGTARANATVHVLPEVAAEAPLALVARADPVAARAGDDVFLALRPSGGQPPYRLRALRDGVEVAVVDGRAALGALDAAFAWVAEARDAAGAVARVEGSLAPAPDAAPKASLGVAADGRTVVADASATRDPEARPLAYRFVWGDGEATPWGPDPFAVHTYRDDGAYEISVEALDAAGQAARATQGVVLAVPIVAAPTRSPTLAPVTDPGAAPEPYRPPRAGALETHPRELPTSAFAGALVLVLAAALPHRARAAQGRSRARRSRR